MNQESQESKPPKSPIPPVESKRQPVSISVDAGRFVKILIGVCILAEIAFVILDYHVNYGRATDLGPIRRFANIAREDGLASWFGTAQTLLISVTLWLIYMVVKNQPEPRWKARAWLVLAAFFFYMSADDGAQIHERFGTVFKTVVRQDGSGSLLSGLLDFFPSYTWQLVFLPMFGALGLFILVFLHRELDDNFSRGLVMAALGGLVLAVGLDFQEGLEASHRWNLYSHLAESPSLQSFAQQRFGRTAFDALVHFSKSIEEFLEMLANTLLWWVFLRHGFKKASQIQLRLTG